MSLRITLFATMLIVIGGSIVACSKKPGSAGAAGDTKVAVEGHTHGEWWCSEHGVPEAQCALCDTKLVAKFKADGDWCEEHNRPDTQCFICHPEKEAEFAALYEAKYGEKPPKPGADGHDHGHDGPHGGQVIELGTEEHHAELTHDDTTHRIGLYVLGGDAKTAAPIEAASVTINVVIDGKPTEYVLPAVAQAGETGGKSSYFELVSEPLCDVICGESDAEKTRASLTIPAGSEPLIGAIEIEAHDHHHEH